MLQPWRNVSSFNAVPSDGAVWPGAGRGAGLAAGGVTYSDTGPDGHVT